MLGVAWDGTGYGADGTVWGGEFIVVDRAARTARRVAHLWPFRLPGGEAAVREPRRSALGMMHAMFAVEGAQLESQATSLGFRENETATLQSMLARGIQAPVTTSAGRLFDGVAALLGLRQRCSFEGQAAMEVEFAAARAPARVEPWPMPVVEAPDGAGWLVDWRPTCAALLQERKSGEVPVLAARFHAALAASIVDVAKRVGVGSVVLTGGCFQNARLLETTAGALRAAGFAVLQHRQLPPNDGGLAAGQALAALWGFTGVIAGHESAP